MLTPQGLTTNQDNSMSIADRISAAIKIIAGKINERDAAIALLAKDKQDAVDALAPLQAQVTDLTAKLGTANDALAAIGDPAALATAAANLEALAQA